MNKPAKVLGIIAVMTLGYSLGSCGNNTETITETKVVKVPTVVTKIETKEVSRPFPRDCIAAAETIPRLTASDGAQTEAVGKILLALQEKGGAAAFNQVQQINHQTTVVRRNGQILSTASNERQIASSTFNAYMTACLAAIAENK